MGTIKCEITKKDLEILYAKLCIYENGTGDKKDFEDYESIHCDKCILRNIEWIACIKEVKMNYGDHFEDKPIIRDLCFAIWHDGILTENPKHIHH